MPPFNPNPSSASQKSQEKERGFDLENFNPLSYKKIEDMPEAMRGYFLSAPENQSVGFKPNAKFLSDTENVFGFSRLPTYLESIEHEQNIKGVQLASAAFIAKRFGHLWASFFEKAKVLAWSNGREVALSDLTFLANLSEEELSKNTPSGYGHTVHHSNHTQPGSRVNHDGGLEVFDSSASRRFSWNVLGDGSYKILVSKGDGGHPDGGFSLFEVHGTNIGNPTFEIKSNVFELRHVYALEQALRCAGLSDIESFKQAGSVAEHLPESERIEYEESKDKILPILILDSMILVQKTVFDLLRRNAGILDAAQLKRELGDIRSSLVTSILDIYGGTSIQELVENQKLNKSNADAYLHSWQVWDLVFENYDSLISSFITLKNERGNKYAPTEYTMRNYFKDAPVKNTEQGDFPLSGPVIINEE